MDINFYKIFVIGASITSFVLTVASLLIAKRAENKSTAKNEEAQEIFTDKRTLIQKARELRQSHMSTTLQSTYYCFRPTALKLPETEVTFPESNREKNFGGSTYNVQSFISKITNKREKEIVINSISLYWDVICGNCLLLCTNPEFTDETAKIFDKSSLYDRVTEFFSLSMIKQIIRRYGFTSEDEEDLKQEFIMQLLEKEALSKLENPQVLNGIEGTQALKSVERTNDDN